jgi:hypothetical protein
MSAALDVPPLAAARAVREGLKLVEAGYYLTPVTINRNDKGDKIARFHAKWRTDGGWSSDPDQIRDWSAQHGCSFAIVCGPSGVEGVDLDVKPDRGVDAVTWWANEGLPLGLLVVGTPSTGLHTYWRRRRTGRRLPTSAGEVAPGVDTRSVGGLFFAPGSFILGADGEPEEVGYTVQGPLVKVEDLSLTPDEVLDAWATPGQEEEPASGEPDRERRYTMDQAAKYVREQGVAKLQEATEGGRNDALNNAALVFGHFVPAFWSRDDAVTWLTELAQERGLDPREIGPTIRSGLSTGMSQPYTKVDNPFASASDASAPEPDAYTKELERERIRRRVRAELDAAEREPLRVLSADEFLDSPSPDYLVPKMFYRDGLSVVFGAPGAAKSFLVLDVALSLATGTPWRDQSIGRGRVHYVMAEGQATNTLRTRAWLAHRDVDRAELRDWWSAIPTAVMLTDSGVVDYLPLVEKDKPDLIVLDTKNLMFAGKESQGDDYGQMLRVLHRIREAADGAAVVLIDHSGLADDTRTRGSNAQKGGVETEVRVTNENGIRRAEVTRDKSGADGAVWLYKLVQVPEVTRASSVDAPAVCVPMDAADATSVSPFGRYENWNDPMQPSVPDDVMAYQGPGHSAIRGLSRFMRYSAGGSVGFSLSQARKAVREVYLDEKGKPMWSADTIDRAWNALVDLGRLSVAETGGSTARSLWETRPGDPE